MIVLQDQSQIPGFPRTQSDWVDSKDAAIALTERIDDEGADVMLLMTWGRRSGDSMNTVRYPNFTAMNDHLLQGYLDYASNATSAHPSPRCTWLLLASLSRRFTTIFWRQVPIQTRADLVP